MLSVHLVIGWGSWDFVRKGYPDFTIFYSAGKIVRSGLGEQLYDEKTQYRTQQEFASGVSIRHGALPYNHPPFEAAWFVPFTYVPYPWAFALWGMVNLAMLVALPFLLRPNLPQLQNYAWPVWVLASVSFFPIFVTLLQGQDAILLLFLYALAFDCLKKNRDACAGGWLGVGLFKPHLVLPLILLLLVQNRKKILYGFLPVAAVLALISTAIVGWGGIWLYPRYAVHLENTLAHGAIVVSDMPNLRGALALLFPDVPHIVIPVLAISLGLLLFAAREFRKTGKSLFDLKFSLAVITTVLVSYHTLVYDLSVLMMPVLLVANDLLGEARFRGYRRVVIMTATAIFFLTPLQLVLSLHGHRLALLGWALLLWFSGIAREISFRSTSPLETISGS